MICCQRHDPSEKHMPILRRTSLTDFFPTPSNKTPIFVVLAVLLHLFLTARIYIQEIYQDNFDLPPDKLLTDLPYQYHCFTLVLDLTDTLVESDWKGYTFFNTHLRSVKRPGLKAFLQRLYQHGFEIVLYTDELTMMTHSFMESFDKYYFHDALTRSTTLYRNGKRYRDLSRLNRDPSRVLYVSAHALENCLQPENCVLIKPWNKEADDTTLADLLAFLEDVARSRPNDVRPILASFKGKDVAAEYRQRCMLKAEEERKLWKIRKSRCESWSDGRGMGPVNMMARQQSTSVAEKVKVGGVVSEFESESESESESDSDG